jgi:hypothetical protein
MRPLVLLLLTGCASDPPLSADYDAACAGPEDCVLVLQNGYCGACDAAAALSADGSALFVSDQEAYGQPACRGTVDPACSPVDLTQLAASCEARVCAVSAAGG